MDPLSLRYSDDYEKEYIKPPPPPHFPYPYP